MDFFQWDSDSGHYVNRQIWIYVVVSSLLTAMTVGLYWWWNRLRAAWGRFLDWWYDKVGGGGGDADSGVYGATV